jgi:hypothetical protein
MGGLRLSTEDERLTFSGLIDALQTLTQCGFETGTGVFASSFRCVWEESGDYSVGKIIGDTT